MNYLFKAILDIVYPQNLSCILCKMPISRTNRYSICKSCYNKMVFISNACPRCGKPVINTSLKHGVDILDCDYCRDRSTLYDRNISFLEYDDTTKHLVFDFKYNSKTFMANIISSIMGDMLENIYSDLIKEIDCIAYVPISEKRIKERGFNQAYEIGKRLGYRVDIECLDILVRKKETRKLHGLSADERKKELRSAFKIDNRYKSYIDGKVVAVVDDIFTTGATLNEISKELKIHGASQVIGLTFLTGAYQKPIVE